MSKRKAFNFYKSFYDVLQELEKDRDKVLFIEALLERQFYGVEPNLTGMAKMAYNSQRMSIDQQVKGWEDAKEEKLAPPEAPLQPPPEAPLQQVQVQGQVQGKEEGQVQEQQVTIWPDFEDFWNAYDKKVGKPKAKEKWNKLSQGIREKIMTHLEAYVPATPEKKFRKDPSTYLNNKAWEDEEIINQNLKGNGQLDFNKIDPKQLAQYIRERGF